MKETPQIDREMAIAMFSHVLENLDPQRLTKQEILDFIKLMTEKFKEIEDKNLQELKAMRETFDNHAQSLSDSHSTSLSGIEEKMMTMFEQQINKLQFDHEAMMAELQAKADSLVDGQDADETLIVDKVLAKLPPPDELKEETPEEIANKLETLQGDERLDASAIKGLKEMIEKYKVGGGFVGAHILSPTKLEASGTIDGSNATFTFAGKPTFVVVNGATYDEGYGWTYVSEQVVLDNAPPSNSRVYGIK